MDTSTLVGIALVAGVVALFLIAMVLDGIRAIKNILELIQEQQQSSTHKQQENVRIDRSTLRNIYKMTEAMYMKGRQGRTRK